VRDAAGANEHHAVSSVVGLDIVDQVVALDAADVFGGAEDGAAERLVLEGGRVEVVEDDFFELLVDLFLFAEDNIALALNGLGVEFGVLEDVREDVDCDGDVGVEGFSVVDGVFALKSC
jgi:hypothetical protein